MTTGLSVFGHFSTRRQAATRLTWAGGIFAVGFFALLAATPDWVSARYWINPVGVWVVGGGLILTVLAFRAFGSGARAGAMGLLLLVAMLLRLDMAARWWLSPWDERYHALVARNVMRTPLKPMLVANPLVDVAPKNWLSSHVWLHKPPMTFWIMSASMRVFGINEIAMRIPSVVLSTLGVLVTFLLAKRFISPWGAFFAASFQTWHARSALLAGGRRTTDHVDTLFIFLVGLGVLASAWATDDFVARRRRAWAKTLLVGMITGVAYLTKDAPTLIIPAVLGMMLLNSRVSWPARFAAPALVLAVAAALVLPWELHIAQAFPEAYADKCHIATTRLFQAVEGHGEHWYYYLSNLFEYFGPLTFIPLAAFFVRGIRQRRDWLPLLGWFTLTYGVFTLAATKAFGYVFIASPVIWIALGWFCATSLDTQACSAKRRRFLLVAAWIVALAFLARAGMRHRGLFNPTPRRPTWANEFRYLASHVERLPKGKWIVFNVYAPTEAMFYTGVTCRSEMPDQKRLQLAKSKGFRIAIYGRPDKVETRNGPEVTVIPFDPRTRVFRGLLRKLRARRLDGLAIFNARQARDLDEYLSYFLDVKVLSDMPKANRKLSKGKKMVVLVGPQTQNVNRIRSEFPQAILIEAPELARE